MKSKKQTFTETNPRSIEETTEIEFEVYVELEELWHTLQERFVESEITIDQLLTMMSSGICQLAKRL